MPILTVAVIPRAFHCLPPAPTSGVSSHMSKNKVGELGAQENVSGPASTQHLGGISFCLVMSELLVDKLRLLLIGVAFCCTGER